MTTTRGTDRIPTGLAWLAGMAAVVLGAGIGELAAALLVPAASPVGAVGGALIDIAPPWAKDAAVSLFGTADKVALVAGIAIVGLVLAGLMGVLESRKPPWGAALVAGVGAVGAIVAMTRPEAEALAWIPSVIAGVVSALALTLLVGMLLSKSSRAAGAAVPATAADGAESAAGAATAAGMDAAEPGAAVADGTAADAVAPDTAEPDAAASAPRSRSRRAFFAWAGVATIVGIAAAAVGSMRSTTAVALGAVRRALTLPAATVAAPAIPAEAELDIPGLATYITPNASFYRIDTALIVPEIDPADWELRVHGMVEEEYFLSWDELLALPLEESITTLACVSNPVGGELIGTATWLGYPIRHVLERARVLPDADMVLSKSRDGFSASTPLETLTDGRNAILAVAMNGEPLPFEHGFPVRMVVPGLYGYVSATKWVTSLEVTRFDAATAYWTDRGWAERGPVKLQSRIDVPRDGQLLRDGESVVIAGVAWQQHVGISGVEVQIDEEPWQPAALASAVSADTWVQWSLPWQAVEGEHVIRCRATSTTGEVQTEDVRHVIPDGATGWHERTVTVGRA